MRSIRLAYHGIEELAEGAFRSGNNSYPNHISFAELYPSMLIFRVRTHPELVFTVLVAADRARHQSSFPLYRDEAPDAVLERGYGTVLSHHSDSNTLARDWNKVRQPARSRCRAFQGMLLRDPFALPLENGSTNTPR